MHFVPSMLAGFLADEAVTADASWAAPLRHVFASGEALPAADAHRWHALTGTAIHNLYGPTEAAVDVTAPEPLPEGHPIFSTPGIYLTPHLASATAGMDDRQLDLIGAQLQRLADAEELANVVRAPQPEQEDAA